MAKSGYLGVSRDNLKKWRYKFRGILSHPYETEIAAAIGRQNEVLQEAANNKDLSGKPMLLTSYTEVGRG